MDGRTPSKPPVARSGADPAWPVGGAIFLEPQDAASESSVSPRLAEAVAHAADRVDQRRLVGVDLLAEVADVCLHDAGVAIEVIAPHMIEDLGLRQDPAGVEHEVAEELVLS